MTRPWAPPVEHDSPLPDGSGEEAMLARAALLAGVGGWECDLADDRLVWTRGVYRLFGLAEGAAIDRPEIAAMYDEESRETMERLRAVAIATGGSFAMDAQIRRADGALRWMRLTARAVMRDGRATHLYGSKQDVTEERQRLESMRRMAEQDPITGVAGRALFQQRFLHRAEMAPLSALVLFDLDGFKQINDRHGHAAGDACLAIAADRLVAAFPEALMIARIGGDEFAVLLPTSIPRPLIERRVAAAVDSFCRAAAWNGQMLCFGTSAGIAVSPRPADYDPEALFAEADRALYAAKRAGRNGWRTAPTFRPLFS